MTARVRFAPSPTGFLHIGGARTALFNWIYAQSVKGAFILRIEDTDLARSKKEFLDEILDSLSWLGLVWDEAYHQSQRFDIYRQYAKKLLDNRKAYIEKSPEGKEAVIFRLNATKVKIQDLIRGEIEFDASIIKDQVLIKSDGTPTYNFACVVDDAEMKITHVIRGDDHISNTPKQALLYEALGFPLPRFAHLPLILNKGGGRLSKRTGATAISDYRALGYLPEALVNYLLLLGWAPGENREIIDIRQAIKLFDIRKVSKTAAVLDLEKLDWINAQYIKNADPDTLCEEIIKRLREKGVISEEEIDRNYIASLVKLFQGRMSTLNDFIEWADFFFLKDINIEKAAHEKYLSVDFSREFSAFLERLEGLRDYTVENIEQTFRDMVKELGIEARTLIHPIRVALTGKTVGPGLFDVIYHLGKDRVRDRLEKFVNKQGG